MAGKTRLWVLGEEFSIRAISLANGAEHVLFLPLLCLLVARYVKASKGSLWSVDVCCLPGATDDNMPLADDNIARGT